jgi:vacuolar-type H+-ATPase subunit C/Vma6
MLRGIARGGGAESLRYSVGNGYLLSEKDLMELSTVRFEDLSAHVPYAYQKLVQEVVTSYAKAKRITVIGDIVDRYEFGTVKSAIASKLMSPIMIVWYLILKENEVRNLRLVLRATFDSVPIEEIKDYLVMKA